MAPAETMRAYTVGHESLLGLLWKGLTTLSISHGGGCRDVPTPSIAAGQVLVKVKTVALNVRLLAPCVHCTKVCLRTHCARRRELTAECRETTADRLEAH